MDVSNQNIHFVTGKLAEHAVRDVVAKLAEQLRFDYSITVLPITVAALMTSKWLLRHFEIPRDVDRVILPGHLCSELDTLRQALQFEVECGPRDIRDLPSFFGKKRDVNEGYGEHSIEIIAEINHANRLSIEQLIATASSLVDDGADVIDLGCSPGQSWREVGEATKCLVDQGIRVSIDSFEASEVSAACAAGASLVLSVNSSNREAASDWNTEVVVVPDAPGDELSFIATIEHLSKRNVPFRLDPILEPIGCGFASSLLRYADCRQRYPQAKMMMGIGNITELTDVDSAGLNVLLLGICQELEIQSVLTTQVINWCRSSVRECDRARRLMHYAYKHRVPPKHIEPALVMLRDTRVNEFDREFIEQLGSDIRDKNVRILVAAQRIHALSVGVHAADADPFRVMEQLLNSPMGDSINREHAFYLGFEMAKAMTANHLGKQYDQDQPLNWGLLTHTEPRHRLKRNRKP